MKVHPTSPADPEQSSGRKRNRSELLLLLGLIFMCPILLAATLQVSLIGLERWLPFTLHSILTADYSADPRGWSVPPLGIGIIQEALGDEKAENPQTVATLIALLNTPVVTVTPEFPVTAESPLVTPTETMVTPSQTATSRLNPTSTPTVTNTRPATASPTPILTATRHPTPTAISTQRPRPSPTPTGTPSDPQPTQTRIPTQTPTLNPKPTDTEIAPTSTPLATPKPSLTPVPYP